MKIEKLTQIKQLPSQDCVEVEISRGKRYHTYYLLNEKLVATTQKEVFPQLKMTIQNITEAVDQSKQKQIFLSETNGLFKINRKKLTTAKTN